MKATFCVVGVHVRHYPQLVARIVREGHTLCNHSWHHDLKLGRKSADKIEADLPGPTPPSARRCRARGSGTSGSRAGLDRGGGERGRAAGHDAARWAVDPQDWAKPGTPVIISRVTQRTRAGLDRAAARRRRRPVRDAGRLPYPYPGAEAAVPAGRAALSRGAVA